VKQTQQLADLKPHRGFLNGTECFLGVHAIAKWNRCRLRVLCNFGLRRSRCSTICTKPQTVLQTVVLTIFVGCMKKLG